MELDDRHHILEGNLIVVAEYLCLTALEFEPILFLNLKSMVDVNLLKYQNSRQSFQIHSFAYYKISLKLRS